MPMHSYEFEILRLTPENDIFQQAQRFTLKGSDALEKLRLLQMLKTRW